jgi:hypothetical protein
VTRAHAGGLLRAVVIVWAAAALLGLAGASAASADGPWIRLESPSAFRIFQRDASGHGTILVSGRCASSVGRLRVTWGKASVLVTPSGEGRFRARLGVPAPGQATLTVAGETVPGPAATREGVGVGDIYVIAGQSNASGRGPNLRVASNPRFTACMFANDYRWKALTDPVDSPAGQLDGVSRDPWAGGSVWPLVATRLMAVEDVPVAFVPCACGNTTMRRWLRVAGRPRSRRTLYGSLVNRVRAVGGRVRAVLLLQGESDARASVPPEEYASELRRFAAQIAADVGAPIVVGQVPDFPVTRYPPDAVDAIRDVQVRAEQLGPGLRLGPSLYDIDLGGWWHIMEPDDQEVAAERWAAAVLRVTDGADVPQPPCLLVASREGARVLALRFTGGALAPGPVGGISVEADGLPVAVSTAEVTGDASVRVVLADDAPPGAIMTVSIGRGRDGAGAHVPAESSSWSQPAPTCLRLLVTP